MIPSFEEVHAVTREISSIVLLQPEEARGLYDALIQVPRGGLVVEIGCNLGRSSSLICQLQQAIGFRSIHVDPYRQQPEMLASWVKMMHSLGGDLTHNFTLLCMRTEQARWMFDALGWAEGANQIDLAYIDGDHEAPAVAIDLEVVADKIAQGGLLAVHDYAPETDGLRFPDVSRLVDEYTASGWEHVQNYKTLGVWRRK